MTGPLVLTRGVGKIAPKPVTVAGVWTGTVTRVAAATGLVFVQVPDLGGARYEHGPMKAPTGTAVGQHVVVSALGGNRDTLIVVTVLDGAAAGGSGGTVTLPAHVDLGGAH